jgi:hypothetical protein
MEAKGYEARSTTIKKLPVEEKRIIRCLTYLKMLIKNSEKDGTHGLIPHSALIQGSYLDDLVITNSNSNFKSSDGYRAKFNISTYSNITVYQFKQQICYELAQRYDSKGVMVQDLPCHPMNITLSRYSTSGSIKDIENGSTLEELKFYRKEGITITNKSLYSASKVPLLNENKEDPDLNDRARFIFSQMFDTYSIDDPERPGTQIMGL